MYYTCAKYSNPAGHVALRKISSFRPASRLHVDHQATPQSRKSHGSPRKTARNDDANIRYQFQFVHRVSNSIYFIGPHRVCVFFSGARPRPLVPPKLPPVQLFAVLWFAMNFQAQVFPPPNETVNEVELKQNKKKRKKKVAAARREKSPPE